MSFITITYLYPSMAHPLPCATGVDSPLSFTPPLPGPQPPDWL
jgi:hypothetical protein